MKNECSKIVSRENAYEIWATPDLSWKWYVLKKYKSQKSEDKDEYARWFCDVTSPIVGEEGEKGDVYVKEIKSVAYRIK